MEDRVDPKTEEELRGYLSARLDRIPVRSAPRFSRSGASWLSRSVAAPIVLVLLVAAVAGGVALGDWRAQRGSPAANDGSPQPTASVSASATPSPSASPALPPGTFENRILGYRITLPVTYRRFTSSIAPGTTAVLGGDAYTTRTADQVKDDCRTGAGSGIGGMLLYAFVNVEAHRNPEGLSAARWAPGSTRSTHALVEPAIIAGYDAARLVQGGEVRAYVISANDRIYVLARDGNASAQLLADAAESFQAIAPAAFPSPTTPPQAPRDAAAQLAQRLAQAFAAKDADTIAGLMTDCRVISIENIGGSPLGTEGTSRFAADFVAALRGHFARGELSVTVDPNVQQNPRSGQFFVTSEWREADRTTRIDLLLGEQDGRWQWFGGIHYYPALTGNNCIPYRSPWVASSC